MTTRQHVAANALADAAYRTLLLGASEIHNVRGIGSGRVGVEVAVVMEVRTIET